MERTDTIKSCDNRAHVYKNYGAVQGRSQKKYAIIIKRIIREQRGSWTRVLDTVDHDELVYKLTLKYLRQRGYDI